MRKSWAFITFAAFAAGIFCGAALLSRPAALQRQPEPAQRETAQPAPAKEWEQSQKEILKILGEIYPAGPVRVSGRP
jgi:hypothetical protein